MLIPVEEYLNHALKLSDAEAQAMLSLQQDLPGTIVDSHVHTSLVEHLVRPFSDRMFAHMMTTIPGYSIETSRMIQRSLFDQTRVRSIRFPHVFPEVDREAANQYLLDNASAADSIVICGMLTNPDRTVELLQKENVVGLKMYYHDSEYLTPKIRDYFLPQFLDTCAALGKPIILHLPRPLPDSVDDLLAVAGHYSTLPIVLAHCGVVHLPSVEYEEALARCVEFENVVVDTARVESTEVVGVALKLLGSRRVLFGSDEPLSLLRARSYIHPVKGERIIADRLYHWSDVDEFKDYQHLTRGLRLSIVEQLVALMSAIRRVCQNAEEAGQDVFYRNAVRVFSLMG